MASFNTVAGCVLASALFAMVVGKISTAVVHAHKLEKPALAVSEEASTETAAAPAATEELPPIGPKLASANVEAGKAIYEATCLACHQQHGMGQAGLAPPLVGSEWVTGSEQRLIRIVLNGLRGPIQVKGDTFELDMPTLGVLDDDQIAAALTYVRREWGHTFEPVAPAAVQPAADDDAASE